MVRHAALALGLTLLLFSQPLLAITQLKASLDKNPMLLGETAVLELVADGDVSRQPDFSVLEPYFEVQGPSIGQQMQVFNGQASRTTSWRLLLKARDAGRFVIPAFTLEGVSSSPINVEVQKAPERSSQNKELLFVESSLDQEQLYVQQLSYLTVKIYFKGDLQRGSLNEPKVDGLSIEQQGKDQEGSDLVNGERYRTFTRRYRLIPEQSGEFTIPPAILSGEMLDRSSGRYDYFAQTQSITATSNSLTLHVAPQPADFPGDWLVAGLVELTEEWSPAGTKVRQGEPVTRTITLTALDVASNQLPDLPQTTPEGVKLYREQPQSKQAERNGRVVAQKVFSMAVVATKSGELTLPKVRLPWWNAKTNQLDYAELPEVTLQVEPGESQSTETVTTAAVPSSASVAEASPWAWTYSSSVLLLLWLCTLALWVWKEQKNRKHSQAPVKAATTDKARMNPKKLQQAAHGNDAVLCRSWLLDWAEQYFGERPQSLSQLGLWCKHPDFAHELNELNQALYQAGSVSWQGKALWQAWSGLQLKKQQTASPLASLYPESQ
ncbi:MULTISPECIES: BatD family protein [Rheinheimera]|uniref:BatD family protein n=1 Tax=Rheinheimera marina TaxID=1774958 RepID=A0ABV9JQJ4_9GAMM